VAFDGAPEVAIYGDEVTESGRVEMLPFVKEQAVSITTHRFGAPDPRFLELSV
jgi:RHH-type proline utilization regulon transcriptional repressor/proline dehydrogenase/delta 1-pyrroline-5-carboxylate dehydrogenase